MPPGSVLGSWLGGLWLTIVVWTSWLMGSGSSKKKKKKCIMDKEPCVAAVSKPEGAGTAVTATAVPATAVPATAVHATGLMPYRDRIEATLYGNCIGDAIGLLSEFMHKEEAYNHYSNFRGQLEYKHKYNDHHRVRWHTGDWTDDSDQMILIMQSLVRYKGKANPVDFGAELKKWVYNGFPELGDTGGCGIGATTYSVICHKHYDKDPAKAAVAVWERSKQMAAPNGAVMRTSVVAAFKFHDLEVVTANTLTFCTVSHADPRCQASCVAVTTAIALMLQGKHMKQDGEYDVEALIDYSVKWALQHMDRTDRIFKKNCEQIEWHAHADLVDLALDEDNKIGYTLKCMGAGFWALRQTDFRQALEDIVFEGGDADTNGAVAGALLGCKLGMAGLPTSWLQGLEHKSWLEGQIESFMQLVFANMPSKPTTNPTPKATQNTGNSSAAAAEPEMQATTPNTRGTEKEDQNLTTKKPRLDADNEKSEAQQRSEEATDALMEAVDHEQEQARDGGQQARDGSQQEAADASTDQHTQLQQADCQESDRMEPDKTGVAAMQPVPTVTHTKL